MVEQSTDLNRHYAECARLLLQLCHRNGAKHLGSALSCLEVLVELYFSRLSADDDFLLSKGHAAAALYCVLAEKGLLSRSELETFAQDGTRLPAHPVRSSFTSSVKGLTFGTGSLGHGLSLATGMALGNRWNRSSGNVYCLVSDGECQSGSIWEAALFASHHRLSNLTVIVDSNGLQAFGRTEEVLSIEPLAEKWRSFGFIVDVADDGQNFESLTCAYKRLEDLASKDREARPRCLIARTKKGGRVSFMQDKLEWHYLQLSNEQLDRALSDIGNHPHERAGEYAG